MDSNRSILPPQQSRILQLLRTAGPLSRWQVHKRTRLRPNTVGEHVAELLDLGLVREQLAEARGPGRPRVPVSVDPSRRHVVGAAIRPGHVEACRLNLRGHVLGRVATRTVAQPAETITTLQNLLGKVVNDQTFVIGLSTTGFLDTDGRRILFSSALPGQHAVSLDPLFDVTGNTSVVVENDMHALAARWAQEHHQQLDEDVLLVYFDDGELGSALLVRGEPNRGCLIGGNELGHTRLPVETARCYCGHTGCLERILSTEFLEGMGASGGTLLERVVHFDGGDPAMDRMIELLALGLANPINFIRPHRVVLVSQYARYQPFMTALLREIRSRVMIELVGRVQFHHWDQAAAATAETAGWLGLAAVYYPNFSRATHIPSAAVEAP